MVPAAKAAMADPAVADMWPDLVAKEEAVVMAVREEPVMPQNLAQQTLKQESMETKLMTVPY